MNKRLSNGQFKRVPLRDVFWSHVALPFGTTDEDCWEWTGSRMKDKQGERYGKLKSGGRTLLAHRVSFELHRGNPGKLQVLHKCDEPSCVNPSHLFLGTQGDNVRDCMSKGRARTPIGSSHYRAKLNEAAVRGIRDSSLTVEQLASRHKVAVNTIRGVLSGFKWKHV